MCVCVCVCVIAYTKVIIEGGADLHWFDIPSILPSFHLLSALPLSFHFRSSHLLSCHLILCLALSLILPYLTSQSAILGPKHIELYLRFDYACGLPYLHLNPPSSDHVHTNADVITLFVCPILLKISFSKKVINLKMPVEGCAVNDEN